MLTNYLVNFNDEQELIREACRELMESRSWDEYFKKCDNEHSFPHEFIQALSELGVTKMLNDPAHGGLEENQMVTFCAAWEELQRLGGNAAGIWYSTTYPLVYRVGTPEQIAIAEKLEESGTVKICNAATEPGAGSDLGDLKTTYKRIGDGKIELNGVKTFITDSAYSEYMYVTCLDEETRSQYTNFFVSMSAPGVSISPLEKLGLKTNSCCEIYLDGVIVNESDMLGEEGTGFAQQKDDFNTERVISGLYSYGYALCAFEDACRYANQRVQFGKPVGTFQLNQLKIVDMKAKLTNMRHMIFEGAMQDDAGQLDFGYAAMVKWYCVKAAQEVCDDAIQVMGGAGICGDHRVARAWRDCRASRISGGTDEMMVITAAKKALKDYR